MVIFFRAPLSFDEVPKLKGFKKKQAIEEGKQKTNDSKHLTQPTYYTHTSLLNEPNSILRPPVPSNHSPSQM